MPEPTGTQTTSASGGEPAGGGTSTRAAHEPREIVVSRQEKNSLVMRLTNEHGSIDNAALYLAGKQIRYQKRAQEAERQAAELRKSLPAAGALVLTGEQAKAVQKLLDEKVDLVKLPDSLKEAGELRSTVTAQKRKTDVADAAGTKYKPSVLARLLGDSADGKTIGLPIEFKEQLQKKEDGSGMETIKVPYVTVDGKTVALDTWMETDQKDWLEVAKASETDNSAGGSSGNSAASGSSSTSSTATMPRQTATGGGSGGSSGGTKPKDSNAAVDRQMQRYQTPGQRKAAQNKT